MSKRTFIFSLHLLFFGLAGLYAQQELTIPEIQGSQNGSPFIGDQVWTRANVVTAARNGIFFIQSTQEDGNPLTSEGLMVISSLPLLPEQNNLVDIRGIVREENGNTLIEATEILVIQNQVDLPSAIMLSDNFPSGIPEFVDDLESVENQLIVLEDAWICSPSNDLGFSYVSSRDARPKREPGVSFPAPSGFLEWDGNPELMEVFFHAFGGSQEQEIFSNGRIDLEGVIVHDGNDYQIWPLQYEIRESEIPELEPKSDQEISIANLNTLRYFRSDINYYVRQRKLVRYILDKMLAPDVIAFQEVGGTEELEELAEAIRAADPEQDYGVWIIEAPSDIHNGYLCKNTLSNIQLSQLGTLETLSIGGRKHDRPPLLLTANINTSKQQEISILNLHQRSLNGIEGGSSDFVKVKRHEQAISVANMIKGLQGEGRNLIVLGDFNAFEFSDGYVDVLSQISGTPSLGAEFDVVPVLDQALTNVSVEMSEPGEQYSFVFRGNAQILDHCLVGELSEMTVSQFSFIRGNADAPAVLLNADNDFRFSDHDGFVCYLDLGERPNEVNVPIDPAVNNVIYPNPIRAEDNFYLNLLEKDNVQIELFAMNGIRVYEEVMVAFDEGSFEIGVLSDLPQGTYILKLSTRNFSHLGKLLLLND